MRYLFGCLCVCALGLMPLVGCSETAGDGGSGGTAGSGGSAGDGGTGGMPECQSPEDCDDREECTVDTCADSMCEHTPVSDGTACDETNECTVGTCTDGACDATPVADGTACGNDAGTCQVGICSVLGCEEQDIRDAIAAGGGPYTFDCYEGGWVETEAEIVIDNDVILYGGGFFGESFYISGGLRHRVFSVPEGVRAELRGFEVTRGLSEEGSGIWNQGTLSLVDVTVSENVAQYPGGGIRNEGTLTMSNSTVWGNFSLSPGGGLHNDNSGTMAIMNSTVSDNFAGEGADQISNQGRLNVTNSTLSGGAHNVCCAGGGLRPEGGSITISNTVVDGFCDSESAATIQSNGYNIESPGDTCGFDTDKGDLVNVSAQDLALGPLEGWPTQTHALGEGSFAIDVIPADACELDEDQRREPRPETGGTMCDVGAFERQPNDDP